MPITPFTKAPDRKDGHETFETDINLFVNELVDFVPEANALAENVNARETLAVAAAAEANISRDISLASANFKGQWFAGTYTAPAAVWHNGQYWQLVAPSSTQEPSHIALDWIILNTGCGEVENLIINGNFDIWQRGNSFGGVSNKMCADRFMAVNSEASRGQSSSLPSEIPYYCRIRASGETSSSLRHGIILSGRHDGAGYNGQFPVGTKLVIRMLVSSPVGTVWSLRTAFNNSLAITADEDLATTTAHIQQVNSIWEELVFYHTVTTTTTDARELYTIYLYSDNPESYCYTTGWQAYVGDRQLPVRRRPYAEEKALCLQECEVIKVTDGVSLDTFAWVSAINGADATGILSFSPKRILPSIAVSSPGDFFAFGSEVPILMSFACYPNDLNSRAIISLSSGGTFPTNETGTLGFWNSNGKITIQTGV